MYKNGIKRIFDFLLSLIAILILSPLIILIALLVKLKLGSPIIFSQKRPGLNGKIFTLHKFRTMTDKKDENGELLPDHIRMTRFGKILRATSLDEIPELYNILKGEMSFIGPRPLLIEYLPLYNKHQYRRHEVRPGLSGLAQISGRNAISWEERFELDIYYIDNLSFFQDIKIFLITLKKVFVREGVEFENGNQNNKFKGTKEIKKNKTGE